MNAPQTKPRITEPVPIDDILCTELVFIEDLGFGARFVVANEQTCYEAGGQVLVVKGKIVMTDQAIARALDMLLKWLARRAVRFAGEKFLRLVK